jgi:peptide/nickel transport system substrate-binding protein
MARDTSAGQPATDRRALLRSVALAGAAGTAGCMELAGVEGVLTDEEDGDEPYFDAALGERLAAGFRETGFEPPWEGAIVTNENPQRVRWARLVQEELNGTRFFELELVPLEWRDYVRRVTSAEARADEALVCLGWSAGFAPDGYVRDLFGSDHRTPACCNLTHYRNARVDELLEAGVETLDPERRTAIYEQLQREIVSDSPVAFVRFGEEYHAWRSDRVNGFRTYPNDSYPFRGLYAPYAGVYADSRGSDELVAAVDVAPTGGDPVRYGAASQAVCDPVYERLVAVDWDGEPRPQLARSTESLDETTYEFRLREGVRFHPSGRFDFDGREVTAADVAFSVRRFLGTPRQSVVGDWLGVEDGGGSFEGDVEVLDDHAVRFSLPGPYADFADAVAGVPVVPREAGYPDAHPRERAGTLELGAEPIGTGPFRFAGATKNTWRLERFEGHWFDGDDPVYDVDVPAEPPLSAVTFRVVADGAAQAEALRTGDVDLAGGVPPKSVEEFAGDAAFDVDRHVSSSVDLLAYPMHEAADTPFRSRKVRLAVNRLVDRERIVEEVFDGLGRPAYTPFSPVVDGVSSEAFRAEMADEYARYYDRSA